MFKKYFISIALSTSFFTADAMSSEKNYLIAGNFTDDPIVGEKAPASIFVYDPVQKSLVNSFPSISESIGWTTVQSAAYFNNNGTMQILYRNNDKAFYVCDLDGTIVQQFRILDESHESDKWLTNPNCHALLHSGNGSWQVLAGYRDGKIVLWDINSGEKIRAFEGIQFASETYGITSMTLFADGDQIYVAAVSCDNSVCIYNFDTGEKIAMFTGFTYWPTSIAVFKDNTGFNVVAGAQDTTIRCWNIATGSLRYEINMSEYYQGDRKDIQKSYVYGLVLLKNTNQVLIAPIANSNDICLFDAQTGALVNTLVGHTNWVQDARPYQATDGSIKLVSVSWDYTVRVWDVASGTCEQIISTLNGSPRNISLFSQGSNVYGAAACANGSNAGSLVVFDMQAGTSQVAFSSSEWMQSVANFDQAFENKRLFAVSHDSIIGCRIPMWNLADIQVIDISTHLLQD